MGLLYYCLNCDFLFSSLTYIFSGFFKKNSQHILLYHKAFNVMKNMTKCFSINQLSVFTLLKLHCIWNIWFIGSFENKYINQQISNNNNIPV